MVGRIALAGRRAYAILWRTDPSQMDRSAPGPSAEWALEWEASSSGIAYSYKTNTESPAFQFVIKSNLRNRLP